MRKKWSAAGVAFVVALLLAVPAVPASAETPDWFQLEVSLSGPWIHGQAWDGELVQGDTANVSVEKLDGTVWSAATTVEADGTYGSFEVWPEFTLKPGMVVTATASGITKVLTLETLNITCFGQTGVVTGTAPPDLPADGRLHVDTDISPDGTWDYIDAWPGTDANGNWATIAKHGTWTQE